MLSKIILTILFILPSIASAMDMDTFQDIMKKLNTKNFIAVEEFLEENRSECTNDPEYYVILLNYSFAKGNQSQLIVAKGEPKEGDIELIDKESGEVTGFIRDSRNQDIDLIIKGITETQKALSFFNNRLDIHFGIVHIASLIEHWDIVGIQLIEILKVSKVVNNQWKWGSINSMNGDPQDFMLQNVQARVRQLFHAECKEADDALKYVSNTMIKEYPNAIYGYSNLGALYMAYQKYELAEEYLNKAIAIDPEDKIVKRNLDLLKKRRKQYNNFR